MTELTARMPNPVMLVPDALEPIQKLYGAALKSGAVPTTILELVHLRASQINGCGACIDSGTKQALKAGETEQRLFAVSAWRDTPYFTEDERAALELAEAVTRLADRADPVPDELWDRVSARFDEKALATLLLMIGVTNIFNRLNVPTRQQPGSW